MFAKSFSVDQKKLLIILAYRIMVADFKIRPEESDLLNALEHELGIEDQITDDEMKTQPDLSLLDSRESRVGTMLKLFAIAYSDAEYHQSESCKLREYAGMLGFDQPTIDRMARWGRTHMELVREAQALSNEYGVATDLDVEARVADLI
jgi:uncharacterized tellurite resistance protein B-like protein